jgi:hypothetical protein
VDQVRDDLGVRLSVEFVVRVRQLPAQRLVILDDAVVHERDLVAREDRMRVAGGRRAMRRPARVRDAGAAGEAALRTCASRSATRDTLRARRAWPSTTVATPHES